MSSAGPGSKPRRPLGFLLLGFCLGYMAIGSAAGLINAVRPFTVRELVVRGAVLVVTVMMGLTAEALLRCRPSAYRLMRATVVSGMVSAAVSGFAAGRLASVETLAWALLFGAVMYLPLRYVARRSHQLFGPAPPRRPPVPRAQP